MFFHLLSNLCGNLDRIKLVVGDIEVRFVEGSWGDDVRVLFIDFSGFLRGFLVGFKPWLDKDEMRAALTGFKAGHARVNPKPACFIICSENNPPPATNGNRLVGKVRLIADFDGGIEGIHIHVNDFVDGHNVSKSIGFVF